MHPPAPPPPGATPPPPPSAAPPPSPSAPETTPPTAPPGLDDRERGLDPGIVQVWRVFGALWQVPLLAVASVTAVLVLGRAGWLVVALSMALLVTLLVWYPGARFRRWRWWLSDLALLLERGVLVRQRSAVPYFRIQQIDVVQGPIDRLLGLATLQVTTASASGTVGLPGIANADAPTIRAELLWRAAQAVAAHPGELSDAV